MLKKIKENHIFSNLFGFEQNVDITNDVAVLFRKNVVIKNIVLLSNIIYTIIFSIISIGERSNWILTILLLPVTYLVNRTLKRMIYKDRTNYLRQQIAMYICCFYMFLTAILIYAKLKLGLESDYFGEAGYILLYYSLIICSFYQSKKLLKTVYPWLIVLVTIIHFTLSYNVVFSSEATDINYVLNFFISEPFRDIILRTFILLIFMLVLYVSVSISDYISEERKKELRQRQEVENNYTEVVSNLFKVMLNPKPRTKNEVSEGRLLAKMANRLASILGYSEEECLEITNYANIHLSEQISLDYLDESSEEARFQKLKEETDLGIAITTRLQLERKTEDIIRCHLEGASNDEFINSMVDWENDKKSQVVMICDMYLSLRSTRTYKRAISHNNTIELLSNTFRIYYDSIIFDRFIKFNEEFKEMYDGFKEEN